MGLNFNDKSLKNIFEYNNILPNAADKETKQKAHTEKAEHTAKKQTKRIKTTKGNKAKTTTAAATSETTTTQGIKQGTTRRTLQISTEQLETIEALSIFTSASKVSVLTSLIKWGTERLEKEHPTLTKEALKTYRSIKKEIFT